VTINLKKTFIKDQNGVSQSSGLNDQNPQLIGENLSLRNILSDQTNEIFKYQQMVQTLGISLERTKLELSNALEDRKKVIFEKEMVERKLNENTELISCLLSGSSKITNQQTPSNASIMTSTTTTNTSSVSSALSSPLVAAPCSTNSTKPLPDLDINRNVPSFNTESEPLSIPKSPPPSPSASGPSSTIPPRSTPATPPPHNSYQMRNSFRNFLEVYREKDELMFLKLANEMVQFSRNVMHMSLDDIRNFNQHLSEEVRNGDLDVYSSLSIELTKFFSENFEEREIFGKDFYLSIIP
jgi:hypothetical protein